MTGLKKKQSQRALVEPLWLLSLGAEVKYSKSEVKSRAGFVVWWIYKMPIFRVILPAASRFFFKVRESFTLKFWLISNEGYSTHPGKTNSLPLKIASFKKTSTFIKLPVFFCQILSSIHQWVWSTCWSRHRLHDTCHLESLWAWMPSLHLFVLWIYYVSIDMVIEL